MKVHGKKNVNFAGDRSFVLKYEDGQASLELVEVAEKAGARIDHAEAYGRIAFSCPSSQLPLIQKHVIEKGYQVLKPMVSLETAGKATVQVVILADPVRDLSPSSPLVFSSPFLMLTVLRLGWVRDLFCGRRGVS